MIEFIDILNSGLVSALALAVVTLAGTVAYLYRALQREKAARLVEAKRVADLAEQTDQRHETRWRDQRIIALELANNEMRDERDRTNQARLAVLERHRDEQANLVGDVVAANRELTVALNGLARAIEMGGRNT